MTFGSGTQPFLQRFHLASESDCLTVNLDPLRWFHRHSNWSTPMTVLCCMSCRAEKVQHASRNAMSVVRDAGKLASEFPRSKLCTAKRLWGMFFALDNAAEYGHWVVDDKAAWLNQFHFTSAAQRSTISEPVTNYQPVGVTVLTCCD